MISPNIISWYGHHMNGKITDISRKEHESVFIATADDDSIVELLEFAKARFDDGYYIVKAIHKQTRDKFIFDKAVRNKIIIKKGE